MSDTNGNSITELFQRDPLELSRSDFAQIVEHYRKNRLNFNTASRKTASTAATKKLEKANTLAKQVNISLDDFEV